MTRWLAALLFSGLLPGAAQAAESCVPGVADLRGDGLAARFSVEIADDNEERALGLMNRSALAASAGMLFVYDHPQSVSFWMRNTLIPLDMIFLDRRGVVLNVHAGAVPHDLTPIPGGSDEVLAVLEINGGLARRLGIKPGAEMRHPAFAAADPAWPC